MLSFCLRAGAPESCSRGSGGLVGVMIAVSCCAADPARPKVQWAEGGHLVLRRGVVHHGRWQLPVCFPSDLSPSYRSSCHVALAVFACMPWLPAGPSICQVLLIGSSRFTCSLGATQHVILYAMRLVSLSFHLSHAVIEHAAFYAASWDGMRRSSLGRYA